MVISTATHTDEVERGARIALLPVGSFEQHGSHLPLSTDTLIASIIAQRLATDYELFLLPPITISCSHEHAAFAGTVSISAATLYAIVTDVARSLRTSGVDKLVLVNGHGGNYVLSNVVQESNVNHPRSMALFPTVADWTAARRAAGADTDVHEDMHGGEAETSILLSELPDVVKPGYINNDETALQRPYLLTLGMAEYTRSGIIGKPSSASARKGAALLDALAKHFSELASMLARSD